MSAPEGQAPPQSFGRYRDPVMLGSGGMGAVYRATDPSLDRFVAIKVLTHREPKYVERFRREAQMLAKIMHPSIIQIYEIVGSDEESNDPYIVMEYFEGKPLDSALKMGPLSQEQVVSIIRQTCDGLTKAHKNSVIHRDIKPANIMMAANGEVKILDFGIAKALDAKKDLTGQTVLGTPYYMSPEQAMGQPIDARTDIYSLGITAFHLLTGKRPFEAKSKVDVMLMQVKNPLPNMRDFVDVDERVQAMVEKMTSKQPSARYQSCQELIEAVDNLPRSLGGKQTDTPLTQLKPPPPPPPTGAQGRVDAEAPRKDSRASPRAATPPMPTPAQAARQHTPPAPRPAMGAGLSSRKGAPAPPAKSAARPDVRKAPPPAVPKASSRMWIGIVAGAVAGLAVLGGVAFFVLRGPAKGPWRVPAKGWMYPGAPAPPLKKVQSEGGYGNCVFATKELERGKEEAGSVRTIFSGTEGIYGRCYFAHQVGPNKPGEVWEELWVDGAKRSQVIYENALSNDEDQVALDLSVRQKARLTELSAGKHTLDVWIYRQAEDSDNPEPLAAGELVVRK